MRYEYDLALIKQIVASRHNVVERVAASLTEVPLQSINEPQLVIARQLLGSLVNQGHFACPTCGATDDEDADGKCIGLECPLVG